MEFYTTFQPENDISIASAWVGYWPGTDKWEIAWADNSWNAVDNNSHGTFEIRYSANPITNANFSQATSITPEYWGNGKPGQIVPANSWKQNLWTRFQLPDSVEAANNKIYFAIKDISSLANGDGHNSPSPYIFTIDYSLRPNMGGDTTPPAAPSGLTVI